MMKAIILDTNSHGKQLRDVVEDALVNGKVKIVLGENTLFHKEVSGKAQNPKIKDGGKRYREFKRIEFYHFICGKSVNRKERELLKKNLCSSNDPHVIALAIVTGANVLVSNDGNLITDFRDCSSINARSSCLPRQGNVINRSAIKPVSPNDKIAITILDKARIKYDCCECMINGGGC